MNTLTQRELSIALSGVPAHVGPVHVTLAHNGNIHRTESLSASVAPQLRCFVTPLVLSRDALPNQTVELAVRPDRCPSLMLAAFATTPHALEHGTTTLYAKPIVLHVHVESVPRTPPAHPARPLAFALRARGMLNTSAIFARSTAALPLELVVYRASTVQSEAVWIPIFRSRSAGQTSEPVTRKCALPPHAPIRIEALRVAPSSNPTLPRFALVLGALETTVDALRTTPEGGMIPLKLLSHFGQSLPSTASKRDKKSSQSRASPGYIVVHPTFVHASKKRCRQPTCTNLPETHVDPADATDPELSTDDIPGEFDDDGDNCSDDDDCPDTLEFCFDLFCYANCNRRSEGETAALHQVAALASVVPPPEPESTSSVLQSEGDLSSFDEPFRPRMRSIVGNEDVRDYRKCVESTSALEGGDSPFIVLARPRGKTFMAPRQPRPSSSSFRLLRLPRRRHISGNN